MRSSSKAAHGARAALRPLPTQGEVEAAPRPLQPQPRRHAPLAARSCATMTMTQMQTGGRSSSISSELGTNSRAFVGRTEVVVVVPVVLAPALVGGDVGRGWSYLGVVEARMARDGDGEVSYRIFGAGFFFFFFATSFPLR